MELDRFINVTMSQEQLDQLERLSRETGCSKNYHFNKAMDAYIENILKNLLGNQECPDYLVGNLDKIVELLHLNDSCIVGLKNRSIKRSHNDKEIKQMANVINKFLEARRKNEIKSGVS